MPTDLLNKLSYLSFVAYHDPSKNMVIAHFYADNNNQKNDIVAYLSPNMTWDVREIVSESSTLFVDKEVVTIEHNRLGFEPKDGTLDFMIRKGVEAQKKAHSEEEDLDSNPLYKILEHNSYVY